MTKDIRIRPTALIEMTRNLSTFVNSGISVYDSLRYVWQQDKDSEYAYIVRSLADSIRKGEPLHIALQSFPQVFDIMYIGLIRAGEELGNIGPALLELANHLAKKHKFKQDLINRLAYPTFILFLAVVLFFGMMLWFVPSIKGLVLDLQDMSQLGWLSVMVFSISDFLVINGLIILISGIIIIPWVYIRRDLVVRMLSRIPFVCSMEYKLNLQITFHMLTVLLKGGIPLLKCLTIAKECVWNEKVELWLDEAISKLLAGDAVSGVQNTDMPMYVNTMLYTGERTGSLATACQSIAEYLDEEVNATLNVILGIVQPSLLIIIGFLVGGIILGVFLPITSITLK